MTSHVNQLSLILHEQGLENYSNAVQELVRSIDYSTRFVTKFKVKKIGRKPQLDLTCLKSLTLSEFPP